MLPVRTCILNCRMGRFTSIRSTILRLGKVSTAPGFFLFLGGALFCGAGEILPLVFLAVLLHEMGHLLALRLFGVAVEGICFTAFGVEIQADTRFLPYVRELICTMAGPMMNIAAAFLLSRTAGDYLLAGANLLQGCYNLIPMTGLDGAHALHLLVSWWIDPMCADRVCRAVELVCAIACLLLSLFLVIYHRAGGFLLFAMVGIFVGIWRDMRAK